MVEIVGLITHHPPPHNHSQVKFRTPPVSSALNNPLTQTKTDAPNQNRTHTNQTESEAAQAKAFECR